MKNISNFNLQIITLKELSVFIRTLQPELSRALEDISLNKNYNCYKAIYRYGETILKNGVIHLTNDNGNSIPLNHDSIPLEIKNDLIYDSKVEDPLSIFLNKISEALILKDNYIVHSTLLKPGSVIGIPRALNSSNTRSSISSYEINAGGRSMFMLTKISDHKIYQRILKLHNFNLNVPLSYEEHWPTFVQIAKNLSSDWCCEVIFFSRAFINDLKNPEMSSIYIGLNKIYTSSYNIKHNNSSIWNMLYFMGIENDNLLFKYNTNYINIIKHIFMVAANSEIGYAPAIDDEMAPVKIINKFFREIYGVSNPIIMIPTFFNYENDSQAVYLSLNYQKILVSILDKSHKKTNLAILSQIKYIFGIYYKNIMNDINLSEIVLAELLKNIEVLFFHAQADGIEDNIISLHSIISSDERFNCTDNSNNFDAIKSAPFFNGAICLRAKK